LGQRPRIAVDAMGGDSGPPVTVASALRMTTVADLTLVGDRAALEPLLAELDSPRAPALQIVHAGERILPGEPLAVALRHKPDASMRRALALLAAGQVDAVVSAGDTAALMALSRQLLAPLPGVQRPAICKALQGVVGPFWMLDLGANVDCSASQLHQFARMGSALARAVGEVETPRVALLNIGTEPGKGPRRLHEAAAALAADPGLNYVGYIEGNRLFRGEADVVVADGFSGNVALKSMEGAAWMAGQLLRRWFDSLGFVEQAGLALARAKLEALRHELDPQRYNGASFVGLDGVVVKSHGGADIEGFASAIGQAIREVGGDLRGTLARQFTG
jgi:glycerol-3-phosphate acyltransferase PlsX